MNPDDAVVLQVVLGCAAAVLALAIAIAPLMIWIHASKISKHTAKMLAILERAERAASDSDAAGPAAFLARR